MPKIAMLAKLPVQPGTRDEFVAAFSSMFPVVEGEPGTLAYVLHTDDQDADVVWVYELYADDESLAAHSGSEGMKAAISAFGPLLAGRPELIRLTPVQGIGVDL
jgi:quinol monooxygenase YgiN